MTDVNSLLEQRFLAENKADVDAINSNLTALRKFNLRRLREVDFEDVFLPIFTGEPTHYHDDDGNRLTTDYYVAYVGGPNQRLQLTNQVGEPTIVIPPIWSPSKVNLEIPRKDGQNYYEIVSRANNISGMTPQLTTAFMLQHGLKRWHELANLEGIVNHISDWNRVFMYFGKHVLVPDGCRKEDVGVPTDYQPTRLIVPIKPNATSPSNTSTTTPTGQANPNGYLITEEEDD